MNSTAACVSMGGSVLGMQATLVKPPARLDRLVLLAARLAEVHVHVDQAGGHDQTGRVDRLVGPAERLAAGVPHRDDQAVADEDVVHPVDALRGVDHPAAADEKRGHQTVLAGRVAGRSAEPARRGPQVSQSTPIRTARPFVTWSRISDCGQSATSAVTSTPRLIGPGARINRSFFARFSRSPVMA
jgi:hypothetical protein